MPARPIRLSCTLQYVLAGIFALYGLSLVGIMAIHMPPYQNPDELNHFFRAEQISRLDLLPRRLPGGGAGGLVDASISDTAGPFLQLILHAERKATRALYDATGVIGWSRRLVASEFPNTIIYPPTFYGPSVAGIWIGKLSGSPVIRTLYLSRAINGVCAVLIAAIAIAIAEGAALWLFAVLTLPMSLALFGAVSQDGVMIACAALVGAIVATARQPRAFSNRRFALLWLALAAICMARPPYLPLACLILVVPWRSLRLRIAGVALVFAATAAWSLLALRNAGLDVTAASSGIDPKRQLAGVLDHPLRMLAVICDTYRAHRFEYLDEVVGRLGWLDIPLPALIHVVAWAAWGVAGLYGAAMAVHHRSVPVGVGTTVIACGVASIAAVFGIEYLTFSPVAAATIEGVQGRYFIEVLLMASPLFYWPNSPQDRLSAVFGICLALATIVYAPVIVRAVLLRYYI